MSDMEREKTAAGGVSPPTNDSDLWSSTVPGGGSATVAQHEQRPGAEKIRALQQDQPAPASSGQPPAPSSSPVELSDITQLNDGSVYVISSQEGSVTDETLVVTRGTTVIMEGGGYVEAPVDTDWPALR